MNPGQHEIQIDNKNQQDEILINWLNTTIIFLPGGKVRITSVHLDCRFEGGELELADMLRAKWYSLRWENDHFILECATPEARDRAAKALSTKDLVVRVKT